MSAITRKIHDDEANARLPWNDQCTDWVCISRGPSWVQVWLQRSSGGRQELWLKSSLLFTRESLLRCLCRAEAVSDFPHKFLSDLEQPAAHPKGKRASTVPSRLQGVELQLCPRLQPFSCCPGFEKDVISCGNPALKCLSCLTTAVTLNLTWTVHRLNSHSADSSIHLSLPYSKSQKVHLSLKLIMSFLCILIPTLILSLRLQQTTP